MTQPHFDAMLDAMSVAIDLPIPEGSRAAVAANLAYLYALAAEVIASGIPPEFAPGDRPANDRP